MLSVLPVQVQTSPQFAYLRQSVRTNAAQIVSEGAVKPTSTYTVIRVEDKLDVVAHLSEPCPRFWFADEPALQQFLNNELTYGLALAVEAMALADIAGTSGIQSNSYSTSVLQTLRKSVTKLESNGYPPATFVLHPGDFESIELALSTVNAVEHMSLPYDAAARRLWGVPITVTNAQTAGVAQLSRPARSDSTPTHKVCRSLGARRRTPTTGQRTSSELVAKDVTRQAFSNRWVSFSPI